MSLPSPFSTKDSATDVEYKPMLKDDGSAADEDEVMLRRRQRSSRKGTDDMIKHRFLIPIAICTVCLLTFILGFLLGDLRGSLSVEHDGKYDSIRASHRPNVFDVLRALPPADIERDFGIAKEALNMYPEPLGARMCILNIDTRVWQPSQQSLSSAPPNHWGYLNHYLYAKLHGYTYKYIRTQEEDGFSSTWVKVKEQFRMTMNPDCKFVLVMDADTIISDFRVPLEALLGHWNVTKDIAIAGGLDLDSPRASDEKGRTWFNTGFVITQNTPEFPKMMHDWINCPRDVKYKGCSKWKHKWSNEQAAFSNYVRYDYEDIIREMPVEEVHLGGFIMHYWGKKKKAFLRQASHEAISNRFVPDIYTQLIGDWGSIFERTYPELYETLMRETRPADYPWP